MIGSKFVDAFLDLIELENKMEPYNPRHPLSTKEDGMTYGHGEVKPMGCICPGEATQWCRNPLCPRKNPNADFVKENYGVNKVLLNE
jgi:hypothetical protein